MRNTFAMEKTKITLHNSKIFIFIYTCLSWAPKNRTSTRPSLLVDMALAGQNGKPFNLAQTNKWGRRWNQYNVINKYKNNVASSVFIYVKNCVDWNLSLCFLVQPIDTLIFKKLAAPRKSVFLGFIANFRKTYDNETYPWNN